MIDTEIDRKLEMIREATSRAMDVARGRDEPEMQAIRDLVYAVADLHDAVRHIARQLEAGVSEASI